MTRATLYPKANRTVQWWANKFRGSTMSPNVLVLHSTETVGFPSYSGGATAPHLTAKPNFKTRTIDWRQHYAVNKSARALENKLGGVETNTLNAVQIELCGTCDPATKKRWEAQGLRAGVDFIYMPDAPDWFLAELADFANWLHAEWPAFPVKDAAPRGWRAYPSSYGNKNGQRLTFAEWQRAYGIVGHQHVPENSHGDPGAFPIARLVELSSGTAPTPEAPAERDPALIGKWQLINHGAATAALLKPGALAKWLARRKRVVLITKTKQPDILGGLECGGSRAGNPWHYLRTKYSSFGQVLVLYTAGRSLWRRAATTEAPIAKGVFEPSAHDGDVKEVLWTICKVNGALMLTAVAHLDPTATAAFNVKVMDQILDHLEGRAKKHGLGRSQIVVLIDSADRTGQVLGRAYARGYGSAFKVADRTVNASLASSTYFKAPVVGHSVDDVLIWVGDQDPGKGPERPRPVAGAAKTAGTKPTDLDHLVLTVNLNRQ